MQMQSQVFHRLIVPNIPGGGSAVDVCKISRQLHYVFLLQQGIQPGFNIGQEPFVRLTLVFKFPVLQNPFAFRIKTESRYMAVEEQDPLSAKLASPLFQSRIAPAAAPAAIQRDWCTLYTESAIRVFFFAYRALIGTVKMNHYIKGSARGVLLAAFSDSSLKGFGRGPLAAFILALCLFPFMKSRADSPPLPENCIPGSRWTLLDTFDSPGSWSLVRPKFSDQTANLNSSGLSAGPYSGSGAYLSLLFRGNSSTPAILEPEKPIRLNEYSQMISLFLYGWNQPARLTLILRDRDGKQIRSSSTGLSFKGWKRVELELPASVRRQPDGPFQEWYLELMGLEVRPLYNETIAVRLSMDDLFVLSAPAIQLPETIRNSEAAEE